MSGYTTLTVRCSAGDEVSIQTQWLLDEFELVDAAFFSSLPKRRGHEGAIRRFDVTTGLQPTTDHLVQSQEDSLTHRVHDDRASGEMARIAIAV